MDLVIQYDYDEGSVVFGGYVYYGEWIVELKGKYIFGDIFLGMFFYIDIKDVIVGE